MNPFGQTDQEQRLREKNLATIEAYFACRGPDRGRERLPLWAEEDTLFELTFTAEGPPRQFVGRKALEEKETDSNLRTFPDWGFYDWEVFSTQDPGFFVAECIGKGRMMLEDGGETYYKNHYLIVFEMTDGKIRILREIHNPYGIRMALGQAVPQYPWYE